VIWLKDFIWELVHKENPTGIAAKTKSQTGGKGFLGFSLRSANDVLEPFEFFDVKKSLTFKH